MSDFRHRRSYPESGVLATVRALLPDGWTLGAVEGEWRKDDEFDGFTTIRAVLQITAPTPQAHYELLILDLGEGRRLLHILTPTLDAALTCLIAHDSWQDGAVTWERRRRMP